MRVMYRKVDGHTIRTNPGCFRVAAPWSQILQAIREVATALEGTEAGDVARVWAHQAEHKYTATNAWWSALCKARLAAPADKSDAYGEVVAELGRRTQISTTVANATKPLPSADWRLRCAGKAAAAFAELGLKDGLTVAEIERTFRRPLTQAERWACGLARRDQWLEDFTTGACFWARRAVGTPETGALPWAELAWRLREK